MDNFISAVSMVFVPLNIFVAFMGALVGILAGAMPGLSSIMALTIMMPFTFAFGGYTGIFMLLGIYVGAIYGGSVTAILINTPGTANSAATCLDGYPMANKLHQPGRALAISTTSSTIGGLFGATVLFFTAPLLAKVALKFGSPEYFALGIFGLSIVTGISSTTVTKGLLGAVFGLALATIGIDTISGKPRFTADSIYLLGGISFIPLLIGLYAFAQGLANIEEGTKNVVSKEKVKLERIFPDRKDVKQVLPTIFGSSAIGTMIGAIPGTGGDIACWLAYMQAKRFSRHPEKFGTGYPQGVAAPEAANNAMSGGALIPLLTLGIPGDAGSAVMLGALMMQGIIPGPLLFKEQTGAVYTIIFGLIFANICMAILGFSGIRLFSKITNVPNMILTPVIFVFCFVGTYAMNHDVNDIFFMIIAGIVGFILIKLDFSMPPIILGLILGNMVEKNLQKSLVISNGNLSIFFTRPISSVLLIISVVSLFLPLVMNYYQSRKSRNI